MLMLYCNDFYFAVMNNQLQVCVNIRIGIITKFKTNLTEKLFITAI